MSHYLSHNGFAKEVHTYYRDEFCLKVICHYLGSSHIDKSSRYVSELSTEVGKKAFILATLH